MFVLNYLTVLVYTKTILHLNVGGLATSTNCRMIVIAFVERHPKLVARENRDFSGRSST